jgi:hypothetical protein
MQEAADFKSDVSTNFTIRASMGNEDNPKQNSPDNEGWRGLSGFGGATRSRTGLDGFAIRCITALLSRHAFFWVVSKLGILRVLGFCEKKGSRSFPFSKLERDKRLELSTYTLARYRSTN